jgi:hypothetical protein
MIELCTRNSTKLIQVLYGMDKIVVHENHWIVLVRYQVDNPFCTASQHSNLN